ncbi:MAG: helix-turn-helix domain-containing protein [Bacteroidota bacterium]|nr:helix-turn-helix domain-containing protein [Bacteroidota bacterium]
MVKTNKHLENSEETILKAASEIFIEKGFDGARMQEIADKAGLNKALLHYYYRSKDKLFRAVFNKVFQQLMDGLVSVFEENMSVFETIRIFFKEHQKVLITYRHLPVFILNELQRDPNIVVDMFDTNRLEKIRSIFLQHIEKEKQAGIIRQSIQPMEVFINILSLSIFPYAAKPLITRFIGINESTFYDMMEARKDGLADFVIQSIKA